jgi:hypothetical protein
MKEHFVNYNQALALKELGFDEPCIARYIIPGDLVFKGCYEDSNIIHLELTQNDICEAHVLAPLKSQVFKWFRDEHNIVHTVYSNASGYIWELHYNKERGGTHICDSEESGDCELSGMFTTYEGAESACIDRLIEIIKGEKL